MPIHEHKLYSDTTDTVLGFPVEELWLSVDSTTDTVRRISYRSVTVTRKGRAIEEIKDQPFFC